MIYAFLFCKNFRWVHLLCALYTPDVAFVKPEQLQCVTLSELPHYKWGAKVCMVSFGLLVVKLLSPSVGFLCIFQICCFLWLELYYLQAVKKNLHLYNKGTLTQFFWLLNSTLCFIFFISRIVTFVRMSVFVALVCALSVMLACVELTFMWPGKNLERKFHVFFVVFCKSV